MIETVIRKIQKTGTCAVRDVGDFATIRKNGMRFDIAAYEGDNCLRYSTVNMSAFLGLMKMETLVIMPLKKDAPLCSVDYIKAFGKETLILEFYDITLAPTVISDALRQAKTDCADVADNPQKPCWYDGIKLSCSLSKKDKKMTERYKKICEQYADAYLDLVKASTPCDKDAKQACVRDYVDGMFANGSPTVAAFSKILDKKAARELYGKFIFSSED